MNYNIQNDIKAGFLGSCIEKIFLLRKKTIPFSKLTIRHIIATRKLHDYSFTFFKKISRTIHLEREVIEDVNCFWLNRKTNKDKLIIYLHGGGYCTGSLLSHGNYVSKICKETGITTLFVAYELAPESPYPIALEQVYAIYLYLLQNDFLPENIALVGDSAGGGLALALLNKLVENNITQPQKAVLLCPWLDITNTDELYSKMFDDIFIEKNMLDFMAKCYAGHVELNEKYVSPINAKQDFTTSIYVFTAGKDPIQNDGKRLVEMRRAKNKEVYHYHNSEAFHNWMMFYAVMKHSKHANKFVNDFLKNNK